MNKKLYNIRIKNKHNKIKQVFLKQLLQSNNRMSNKSGYNKIYIFFNTIINVNNYLLYFSNVLIRFNSLSFLYNNSLDIKVETFLLNTNINTINVKSLFILKKIRNIYFWPLTNYFLSTFSKMHLINNYYNLQLSLKSWFVGINKNEQYILNINNISIYLSEVINTLLYMNKSYYKNLWLVYYKNKFFYDLYLLYFKKKDLFFLYFILLNNKYNNKINLFLKNYKNLFSKIINKYLVNIIKIFYYYLNTFNIVNKCYNNFSFYLKIKKIKIKKNLFFKKRFNFIYFLNNLINKFIYFIFLYWINLFFKFLYNTNYKVISLNKNKFLLLNQVYNYYHEKRRNRVLIKTRFLSYYKPCLFLLYLNRFNINFNNNERSGNL